MLRFTAVILLFVISTVINAQEKPFKIGDRVNISVDLYNDMDSRTTILVPDKKYTLMYNYKWNDKDRDGKDSIAKVEAAVNTILKLYKINSLRLVCYSYDKGDAYQNWLKFFKSAKPFKSRPEVKLELYNTNDYAEVTKKLKKIFSRTLQFHCQKGIPAEARLFILWLILGFLDQANSDSSNANNM